MSHNYIKETYSFDAKLTDSTGKTILVDCTVKLPSIWGQEVDIRLAVPHIEMPVSSVENPCELAVVNATPKLQLEMNEISYRHLPVEMSLERKFGTSPVSLTHVASLTLVDQISILDNKFYVCLSHVDYLSGNVMTAGANEMIKDIVSFTCPKLGDITLQRYCTKSRIDSSDSFVFSFGYWLEIPIGQLDFSANQILSFVSPILDVLSIFVCQRVLAIGWQSFKGGVRTRFWKDPIQPLKTSYVGVEPKRYLVPISDLSRQINRAIATYYNLNEKERSFVFSLSYSLCPAISLRDGERFMSLFRVLEEIATKCWTKRPLTDSEKIAISMIDDVVNSMEEGNPEVCKIIRRYSKEIARGESSLTTKLLDLLRSQNVDNSDLWNIGGGSGLVGIRNKLAHRGAHSIHHQGLAVATFHLSLLSERLVCAFLGLSFKDSLRRIRRDEWLEMDYVEVVKKRIFDVSNV